jgi:hypothetical protein
MALWRNIGGVATIVQGGKQYWEYSYAGGRDIGLAIAAPNMQEGQINLEMVAVEQGVVQRDKGESIAIGYTVRVQNLGPGEMSYNLNIGDWQ